MSREMSDVERDDAKRLAACFEAWGRPIGDMARYLARALDELEALREFRRRVAAAHRTEPGLDTLDEAIGELLAEYDRG